MYVFITSQMITRIWKAVIVGNNCFRCYRQVDNNRNMERCYRFSIPAQNEKQLRKKKKN
ncbi:MAG: hypothetical protein RLZZ384_848, partial [Pseudomonadota bacterium]